MFLSLTRNAKILGQDKAPFFSEVEKLWFGAWRTRGLKTRQSKARRPELYHLGDILVSEKVCGWSWSLGAVYLEERKEESSLGACVGAYV